MTYTKEQKKEYQSKYRAANKDKLRKYHKKWLQSLHEGMSEEDIILDRQIRREKHQQRIASMTPDQLAAYKKHLSDYRKAYRTRKKQEYEQIVEERKQQMRDRDKKYKKRNKVRIQEYQKAYGKANKEKRDAYNKQYREKHRVELNAKENKKRHNNLEQYRAADRKYRADNLERVRTYNREYYQKNSERLLALEKIRRTKKKDELSKSLEIHTSSR